MKRKTIKKLAMAFLAAATVCLFTGQTAQAAPPAPGVEVDGEAGFCPSEPGEILVTLDHLKEKQAAEKSGLIQYAPAAGEKVQSKKTDTSLPLVIIVVGFEGASENLPDGIAYNDTFDWGDTIFGQEKSVSQYYYDMSLGQFTFVPAVETSANGVDGNTNVSDRVNDGVIHVSVSLPHGKWGNRNSDKDELAKTWSAAILASAPYIDYASYDTDSNGRITTDELALGIVAAGVEASGATEGLILGEDLYLWAHASSISNLLELAGNPRKSAPPKPDGTVVDNFIAMAEILEYEDVGGSMIPKQAGPATMTHELGHYLGLQDLYDSRDMKNEEWSEYGVGKMSLMAGGSWGRDLSGELTMYSLDPWSRYLLGWIRPEEITENGIYTLTGSDDVSERKSREFYFLPISGQDEFYILENHAFTGWDAGMKYDYYYRRKGSQGGIILPSGGIVLWHIDRRVVMENRLKNTVNTPDHRPGVMELYPEEEADGTVTMIRQKKGGTVITRPIFSAELISSNYPELEEGFRLPAYGRGPNADSVDGRFEYCTGVKILSAAGESMQVQVTLDMHTPSEEEVIENRQEATGKAEGGYDVVHYCTVCGKAADRTHFRIPKLPTGWQQIGGKWYYYDADGVLQTGWTRVGLKWFYLDKTGARQTGWLRSGGKWYYLKADGVMKTGWLQYKKQWYYFDTNGVMKTGWKKFGGKWYYLNTDGTMKTGWLSEGGKWYFFLSDGTMAVGWKKIGSNWYFFAGGVMKTGWLSSGGKWYYFTSGGTMVTGNRIIDGKTYRFDSGGVCLNP